MGTADRPAMDRHIDYAPALPRHRRKALRRVVGLALLVAVLALLGWKAGPPAWRHARLLYWQRRAMNYALPGNQPVYVEDSSKAPRLLRQGGYVSSGPRVIWFAKPWEVFYEVFSPPGRLPAATLFLHQRRSSRGQTRLVAVEIVGRNTTEGVPNSFIVTISVIRPGGERSRPTEVTSDLQIVDLPSTESIQVSWYAGQPDPADASHFTAKCELRGKTIVVDGWLQDDDTVKIEPRR